MKRAMMMAFTAALAMMLSAGAAMAVNTINCEGSGKTCLGTERADLMKGTGGIDAMYARDKADTLKGFDEGDALLGQQGDDTLLGGANQDSLIGGIAEGERKRRHTNPYANE